MDMAKITCPHCGFFKEVPAQSVPKGGFKAKCPKCGQAFVMKADGQPPRDEAQARPEPRPPDSASPSPDGQTAERITCPHCGFFKDMPPGVMKPGASVTCPKCRERFVVGGGPAPAASPVPPASAAPPPSTGGETERITCPHCGFFKDLPPGAIREGASITCPKCRERFTVEKEAPRTAQSPAPPPDAPAPALPEGMAERVSCPHCDYYKDMQKGVIKEGASITCPKCRRKFVHQAASLGLASAAAVPSGYGTPEPPAYEVPEVDSEELPGVYDLPEPDGAGELPGVYDLPEPDGSGELPGVYDLPEPEGGLHAAAYEGYGEPDDEPQPYVPPKRDASFYKASHVEEFARKLADDGPEGLMEAPAEPAGKKPASVGLAAATGAAGGAGGGEKEQGGSNGRQNGKPPRKDGKLPPLPSVGSLFDRSWEEYKRRGLMLVFLYLISNIIAAIIMVGPIFFGGLVGGLSKEPIFTYLGIATGLFVGVIAFCWSYASMLTAISADTMIGESMSIAWSRKGPITWLTVLMTVFVISGYLFFFIPGVIFSFWFFCAPYAWVNEDARGVEALLRSREYGRGYWWGIVGRLIAIAFVSVIISIIPFVGPFLSFIFTPFMLIYLYYIYADIREAKGEIKYTPTTAEKVRLVIGGLIGYVFVPLAIFAFLMSLSVKSGMSIEEIIKNEAGEFIEESGLKTQLQGAMMVGDQKEIFEVYTRYRLAMDEGDIETLKEVIARDKAKDLSQPGASTMLAMVKAFLPPSPKIVGIEVKGGKATVKLESGDKDKKTTGKVRFVKEDDVWKVEDEDWETKMDLGGPPPDFNAQAAGGEGASISLDKNTFDPGETITLSFTAPASFESNAWIGIIPSHVRHGSEAENDNYDIDYKYISKQTSGTMTFSAPSQPGSYDFRMHDTDSNGREFHSVTFTVAGQQRESGSSGGYSGGSGGSSGTQSVDIRKFKQDDSYSVYIYSMNYRGQVRLNGQSMYTLKGERDMNYNFSEPVTFNFGKNAITADYTRVPGAGWSELKIQVFKTENGNQITLGEWVVNDESGSQSFDVNAYY